MCTPKSIDPWKVKVFAIQASENLPSNNLETDIIFFIELKGSTTILFWKELGCCIAKLEKNGHKFVPRDLEGRHLGTSKGGAPGTSSEERGGGRG